MRSLGYQRRRGSWHCRVRLHLRHRRDLRDTARVFQKRLRRPCKMLLRGAILYCMGHFGLELRTVPMVLANWRLPALWHLGAESRQKRTYQVLQIDSVPEHRMQGYVTLASFPGQPVPSKRSSPFPSLRTFPAPSSGIASPLLSDLYRRSVARARDSL